jgi:ferric-dicitrate binding protein FerR (iron transport regulator)
MQVTKALLVKFIENKCSREEAELVYQYLLKNPHVLDELFSEADWETYNSNGVIDKRQTETWFAAVQKQKNAGRVIAWKQWLRIAAAAVAILAVGLFVYQYIKPAPKKEFMGVTTIRLVKKATESKQKYFINTSNKPLTYTLADGSEITLYKNSTVECSQPFDSSKRDLLLHGEALFKVAKDKTRPFTVFTENFSTTALGTVFNISAYNNKSESGVKLISGKVVVKNLQSATDPVYMYPGDECLFRSGEQKLELHAFKTPASVNKPVIHMGQAVTETEEEIVFYNAPLQQVFNKIGSIYHVTIHIEAKHLENRKFTGTHPKNESPDELLSTIAGLNNLQISKEGTVYLLRYNE